MTQKKTRREYSCLVLYNFTETYYNKHIHKKKIIFVLYIRLKQRENWISLKEYIFLRKTRQLDKNGEIEYEVAESYLFQSTYKMWYNAIHNATLLFGILGLSIQACR
ncbi:hypothetical protein V1499_15830 [Neobacillus sp. SCS-31]|uniref:hypothetical protein n=1 Tax=Neobacillus oceani TaxID=3115292 RepID=UPI003906C607